MSALKEFIKSKFLPIQNTIDEQTYKQLKKRLTAEEVESRFKAESHGSYTAYTETLVEKEDDCDVNTLLLYKIYEKQAEASRKLSTISSILVFFMIVVILGLVFLLVNPY